MRVIVLGAGLSGLATAALLARAGHQVSILEANTWVGGKSRRIVVAGQRMDTGPALVTFPGVLEQLFDSYDSFGEPVAREIANLELVKLKELGRYFFREHVSDLPVKEDHPWFEPWQRFANRHAPLTPDVTKLLTKAPSDLSTLPALGRISSRYGLRLTTDAYVNGLKWMPEGLRELISIHTLNAGVSPKDTLALYASMTAIMAVDGISVPVGGVNEIALALERLALHAGVEIRLGERALKVRKNEVTTEVADYKADLIVSSLDPQVLRQLMSGKPMKLAKKRSCSGVAIYGVLKKDLPPETVTHSVVMPDDPSELYASLHEGVPPKQTMMFVNYYRAHEIYPNDKPTVALLLTAPADGKSYDLDSDWVQAEIKRASALLGLDQPITELFEDFAVLDPDYFAGWGAPGGALYGATKPLWQSGPFHNPQYHNPFRSWLYRVGASVHPGGGIPAVLGSAQVVAKLIGPAKSRA
ncbi:MAG: NAD(P)/FAD-dependent oxidoreductase [Aquiluna sp.]|jgi:phytoene desaturase|nr:NAD(P)/FAD-dependent oxidoreductase [Aquiluna sp.]